MDAFEQTPSPQDSEGHRVLQHDPDTLALWFALDADRRSRDERTERLRAMRLIDGEDEGV